MYRLVYIFLIIPGLAFTVRGFAQLNDNNLKHFSDLDGTIIYDILPDHLGNMWLATQNGLVRYNGYEFKRFYSDPNDSTTISSILTFALHEDEEDRIWVGCMDAINVYDPLTKTFRNFAFHHLTDFPEQAQTGIVTITEDFNGRIYFGVTSALSIVSSHALLYFDPGDNKISRFEYPDSLEIFNIYSSTTDVLGNVWFMSQNGLFKIDKERKLHKKSFPPGLNSTSISFNNIISSDNKGNIWLTSNTATVYKFDPESDNFTSFSFNDLFGTNHGQLITTTILADSSSKIWIGTNQGITCFDTQSGSYDIFNETAERNFGRSAINCFQFDSFGNLWIGTATNGLLKYNNRNALRSIIGTLDENSPIAPGWVINLYETEDGKIWFSTLGSGGNYSGLNEMDPVTKKITHHNYYSIIPGVDAIFAFTEIKRGEFLMSTNRGLWSYFTNSKTAIETTLPGLPDSLSIFKFMEDSRKNFWVLSSRGLYRKDSQTGNFKNYDLSILQGSTSGSNEISGAFESQKYGLWLITNNGLFLYDYVSDKIERHGYDKNKEEVFVSQDINSFYEDKNGIAWLGTWQGGLSRFNPETGTVKNYTTGDGLPSMSVQGILADEKGNTLWLSTFEGLSRFDIALEQFSNFSLDDGIQSQLFADGSCLKTSDGLFIFGGSNGITLFNPDEITKNAIPPKIFITDFKINNLSASSGTKPIVKQAIYKTQEIKLKYRQNNISIAYLGIHYDNPSRNKYTYILENYDEVWRDVGNQRMAYYYNLPAGEYIFRVKASNSNGIWNTDGASLKIVITPPIWRTWWAYLFYGILLILLIYSLDRFQRNRLILKERILSKEKELAHAREIEIAYHKLKTTQTQLLHSEKMASLGELTAGIAHEIQNPLNFVNNFSEVSADLLSEMDKELETGNSMAVKVITDDLKQNLEKIRKHGQRASSIVKGMLEHSRTSSGQKEPTDINALANEYLRLAYHGLKAKEKDFNADFKTELDETLPKIKVVPQDIGRVLLNLINNAFYAVSEKKTHSPDEFKPLVLLTTKRSENHIEIKVTDNGNGIPADILGKVFQPFFTTKPTGQGTGLGLSLSFDIITNGHGGELSAETKEGEGSTFTVKLPITNDFKTS